MTDKQRFIALRCRLFKMIHQELKRDPCCKSYEGSLEINVTYPDYFEDEEAESGPDYCYITLHCYVLGPTRHYDFKGKTMKEALDKMDEALTRWENGYDSAYE